MQIGTNGPQGKGIKLSIFGVRRSEFKDTRGWRQILMPSGGIVLGLSEYLVWVLCDLNSIFYHYVQSKCWFLQLRVQELMNNAELVSRIATALIKGDMYERVSYRLLLLDHRKNQMCIGCQRQSVSHPSVCYLSRVINEIQQPLLSTSFDGRTALTTLVV